MMQAHQILALIPDTLLETLALETEVNKYSKKLQAQLLFKLLIHCIVTHKDNSLRKMESTFESIGFALLQAGQSKKRVRYSSISERLSSINADYFERLYQSCLTIYTPYFPNNKLLRFDSTIVALSSKILKVGYHIKGGDAENLKQLKFTIGFNGLPVAADFYSEQQYTSENVALRETIMKHSCEKNNSIRVFDRGITSRKTHDEMIAQKMPFISRINHNSKREVVIANKLNEDLETETLIIKQDYVIQLFTQNGKAKYPLRCIAAKQKQSGDDIHFVTNIYDLDAPTITQFYKQRWDIEVFFKFIKQELNFSHLINRSYNGIKVMLYATLIAAILLLVYKQTNKLSGYKIMKLKFTNELEKSIALMFVEMCGGGVFN
jgi:hypothetical protein